MTAIYTPINPLYAWECDHAPGYGNSANIIKCGALIPSIGLSGVGSDTSGNIVFQGLQYLAGKTVSVLCCGYDCGDLVVDKYGQVTVPFNASTGFTTGYVSGASSQGAYGQSETIVALTVSNVLSTLYIPVVIGAAITSQGQLLRPLVVPGMSQKGPTLGMNRRGYQYAMHVVNAAQISAGTNLSTLYAVPLRQADRMTALNIGTSFTGVVWDNLSDDYDFDGMFCWQINRPFAATVVSVNVFCEAEER